MRTCLSRIVLEESKEQIITITYQHHKKDWLGELGFLFLFLFFISKCRAAFRGRGHNAPNKWKRWMNVLKKKKPSKFVLFCQILCSSSYRVSYAKHLWAWGFRNMHHQTVKRRRHEQQMPQRHLCRWSQGLEKGMSQFSYISYSFPILWDTVFSAQSHTTSGNLQYAVAHYG